MEKKFRLPKKFAEKWLEALRSGEYKQGQLSLSGCGRGYYCCLGVACRVAGASDEDMDGCASIRDRHRTKYPEIPAEILGRGGLACALADLNDSREYSFPQIADWIEANVELY